MFASRRAIVDGHEATGSCLRAQLHFDVHVDRREVVRLLDDSFDLVVCATTAPGGSWERTGDTHHLTAIARTVARVRTRHLVVLSSTEVYGGIDDVDERSAVGTGAVSERCRQRVWFEEALREYHPSLLVLRLPDVFGLSLDPALLADVFSGGAAALDLRCRYQLHDPSRLGSNLVTSLDAGVTTVNLVSEPFGLADVADLRGGWAAQYLSAVARPTIRVVRTVHASTLGGDGGFVLDQAGAIAVVGRWMDTLVSAVVPVRRVS